jgi:hypothetical protein
MIYEDILKAAAEEAAEAATNAFGRGHEPPACSAYEFIKTIWDGAEDPSLVYLPVTEMPPEFEAAYDAAVGRAAEAQDAIAGIAARILGIGTLDTRHRDALDFHELSVDCLRRALEAAYEAGLAANHPGFPDGSITMRRTL